MVVGVVSYQSSETIGGITVIGKTDIIMIIALEALVITMIIGIISITHRFLEEILPGDFILQVTVGTLMNLNRHPYGLKHNLQIQRSLIQF